MKLFRYMIEKIVNSRGQIVIPKIVRDHLRLKGGQKIFIEVVDGFIRIKPVPKDPVKALKGLAKGLFTKSSTELVRELRDEWK